MDATEGAYLYPERMNTAARFVLALVLSLVLASVGMVRCLAQQLAWEPEGKAQAVVVCVHGLGMSAQGFEDFGQRMAKRGVAVYAVNLRGFGPPEDRKQYKSMDLTGAISDIKQLLQELRLRYPGTALIVLGESMGANIALRVARLYPDLADGLICSAPAFRFYKAPRTALLGLIFAPWPAGPRQMLVANGVIRQATSSEEIRQHIERDKEHRTVISLREALSFYKFIRSTPADAARLRPMPVLMVQGLRDQLANPKGTALLFRKLSTGRKEFVIDARAEHLIIHEAHCPQPLFELIAEWVRNPPRYAGTSSLFLESGGVAEEDKERAEDLFERAGIRTRL